MSQSGLPGWIKRDEADQRDRADRYVSDVTNLKIFESRNARNINSLTRFLAERTSTPVNVSKFSKALEISRPTVDEYLAHLEEALLIHRLPGWKKSKDKSEISRAKVHFFDSGIATTLGRLDPVNSDQDRGRLVETFLVNEILAQAEWGMEIPKLYHWRDSAMKEVDLVAELRDGRVICIEVKASENVTSDDFSGIDQFRKLHPSSYHRGFVFYSGDRVAAFGENRWAIPFAALRPEVLDVTKSEDVVGGVISNIAQRRTHNRQARSDQGRRVAEFTTEILNQLERFREGIGLAGHVTSPDHPNPKWRAALKVRRSGQEVELLTVTIDLLRNKAEISVLQPHNADRLQPTTIDTKNRTATDVVGELFERSESALVGLLDSWDRQDGK